MKRLSLLRRGEDRQQMHEMLFKVYRGTATPRDQGPGAGYEGCLFTPCWFWLSLQSAGLCIKSPIQHVPIPFGRSQGTTVPLDVNNYPIIIIIFCTLLVSFDWIKYNWRRYIFEARRRSINMPVRMESDRYNCDTRIRIKAQQKGRIKSTYVD